jgi:hypothetical protein
MTALKRAFAVSVSVVILGMQLWVILPPQESARWKERWFWPFMRYPMYSVPKYKGDVFASYQLTGTPCAGGLNREIDRSELGMSFFVFLRHARPIAGHRSVDPNQWTRPPERTDYYRDIVTGLVRSSVQEPICTLHLWEQPIVLGETDDPYNAPWNLLRSWPVPHGDDRE